MRLSGAAIAVKCLLEQGVDTVFGYPGVSILELYDELYKNRDKIRHILTAHEQGAAHAADGYARSTGRTGVCLATSGPGATNLVTGIAAAFMDSSPVVFITCNVDEELLGKDAFQEVDIVGISMPITKCSYLIESADRIADTMREAFAIASVGRPGPVLIDITHNATVEMAEYEFLPRSEHIKYGRLSRMQRHGDMGLKTTPPGKNEIKTVCELLESSEKPLILVGGGVIRSGAANEVNKFSEKHSVPVINTLMGSGVMQRNSGLYFGMAGMYGCSAANYAVQSCDLLIAVGVRFSDRLTGKADFFAPHAKIIHIDIDRSEIDKNVRTDWHIIGSAAEIFTKLNADTFEYSAQETWIDDILTHAFNSLDDNLPGRIIQTINRLCPEAFIVTDVGQHQMWTCRNFNFSRPGQLITSGGYGAMGFGLGAAMGVRAGNPNALVIHITGDGSFGMNMTELATEAREKLPVITIIFNNSALGLVRQNQTLTCGRRYSQTNLDKMPDYVQLASAFGLKAFNATTSEDFESALYEILRVGKGGIIDCKIDKNEIIQPMLQKGRLIY